MSKLPRFPDSYKGTAANDYDAEPWMERNQKKTTLKLLQFLRDPHLGNSNEIKGDFSNILLDLGCGTGFSSEIMVEQEFRVIGVDILWDMLSIAKEKFELSQCIHLHFILADINHLPIRPKTMDHALSISAYNFITHAMKSQDHVKMRLKSTAKHIHEILKANGRLIIEFYPTGDTDLNLFTDSFIRTGFEGFRIKKNPQQKAGQTFLLLKKK